MDEHCPVDFPDDPLGSLSPDPEELEETRSDQNQSNINQNETFPEMSAENGDPGDESSMQEAAPTDYVFWFKAIYCRKLFRSQLRPGQICTKDVFGNSVEGVLRCIWKTAKPQLHRKVVFNDGTPTWSEEEQSGFEDIDQFIMLQDQTKKKLYSVSSITPRVLRSWRGKVMKIFVYVYSLNVETNSQHQKLQRTLISPQNPDRSGAHSTRDDSALAEELRSSHRDIEGHYSSWLLWANFINSAPAHEQDQLKQAISPPLELAKFFRWAAVSEPARLQAMHRGMVVANVVNDGWTKEAAELERDVSLALNILQGVSNRLSALRAKGAAESGLLDAMESALQPEESELSRNLSSRVTDCEDTDHA